MLQFSYIIKIWLLYKYELYSSVDYEHNVVHLPRRSNLMLCVNLYCLINILKETDIYIRNLSLYLINGCTRLKHEFPIPNQKKNFILGNVNVIAFGKVNLQQQ